MGIKVIYEESGENNYYSPVWMVIERFTVDWNKTFYLDIDSPFERQHDDQIDMDKLTLYVPDYAYVLHKTDPNKLGLHLPTLQDYVNKMHLGIEMPDIERIILRISDIEDVLQYSLPFDRRNQHANYTTN